MGLYTYNLSKSQILTALYNHAKPLGMGWIHFTPEPMTEEQAVELLSSTPRQYFDYVNGRVMKVDLQREPIDAALYDRDNGVGTAQRAVDDYLAKLGTKK